VSPDDAAAFGLSDGGFARVATAHGSCILKVTVSENQRPGSLFVADPLERPDCLLRAP